MNNDRSSQSDEETIAPDVAPEEKLPLDPAEAVRLEREKYGDSSANPNRDDQRDAHAGRAEDIV